MFQHALPSGRRTAALALAGLALASAASAQKIGFTAVLNGAQEVPPNPSNGKGTAVLVFDLDANTITYDLTVDGLSSAETAAHIHGFAPPGVNAGVLFPLPAGKTKSGVLNYAEADEGNYLASLSYINIHTSSSPGGEIRGQVVRSTSDALLGAKLSGAQEVPPVATACTGTAFMQLNRATNTIDFSMTFADLSSSQTAAHIHGFAPAGSNAGIQFNIGTGSHTNGSFVFPLEAQEAQYLAGLSYFNAHSSNFPGGEVRGQALVVASDPTTYCVGKPNSLGCVPSIGSTGNPSFSGPDNFFVGCSNVLNNKPGLMFWSNVGPNNVPFFGATLCVAPPLRRTPVQGSGGNMPPDDCSGVYTFNFTKAYAISEGLTAGTLAYCQYWARDPSHPDGTTVSISNALAFTFEP